MTREQDEKALKDKLEDIRRRLMGTPKEEEVRAMQLQMEALGTWARFARIADVDDHHHDHMDDHDHAMPTVIAAGIARPERQ